MLAYELFIATVKWRTRFISEGSGEELTQVSGITKSYIAEI